RAGKGAKRAHDVLNPPRVPLKWANSPTLGTCSSPRMRRADIEVPNHPVDMDSWGRSACYPRGTFYPLSDTPSTRGCRITSPDFRPCLTCRSCSQAPLCTCTQHLIAVQVEGTFWRLRYNLGGNRPSETTPQALFLNRIYGSRLEVQYDQSGISTTTPQLLA